MTNVEARTQSEESLSAEFEQLVAQFEQFQSKIKRIDDQFAGIGEMQNELTALEATAVSPDRSVTVVAGPGGSVKDITLTEEALKQRPQALSATLMSTLQQAVAESARMQATIVDQHMGGDLQLTEQVLETQSELLGTPMEDLRARVAEAAPAQQPAETEQHDDFSEQSFLRADDRPGSSAPPPPSSGGSQGDDFLKNLFDDDR
ncbi:YbaB/EbfC DNA-binding family protein [Amycolatopsis marina]|uniref:YbaB/EbfC DNA-binding family protein n=1 Tax=Amycolatopsis marina TaxID=490629 RepID=A0A1I1A0I6_9PSEU|nr:YbaB/EbfC DNA-binding family protein [Amycolatopsis marina]